MWELLLLLEDLGSIPKTHVWQLTLPTSTVLGTPISSSGFCGHCMSRVSIRQSSKFYVNEGCNHVRFDWLRFTYNYSLHSLYPGVWWLFILALKQECVQDRLWSRSVILPGIQSPEWPHHQQVVLGIYSEFWLPSFVETWFYLKLTIPSGKNQKSCHWVCWLHH